MPEIKTFAPDLNPMSQGILMDCDNVYPSPAGGMRALPPFTAVADALAAKCLGLGCIQDLTVNYRIIAGTATKLYELSNTSWLDVSKAGDYATPGRWRFCPWGNYVLASNWYNPLQYQVDKGDLFADVAGSPPKAGLGPGRFSRC